MSNPFDTINAINSGKDSIRGSENPEAAEKLYTPWMVNRGLSYFPDTIMYANDMNMSPDLPKIAQNDYLLNTIRPRKRFSKWHKPDKDSEIEFLAEFYQVNLSRAREYRSILTSDQINMLKARTIKGGIA